MGDGSRGGRGRVGMGAMSRQEESWWRKQLREKERRARNRQLRADRVALESITASNDALIARLEVLRKARERDVFDYETIMNLPAREVPVYLERVRGEKRGREKKREKEEEPETEEQRSRHVAATKIQREIRGWLLSRRSARIERALSAAVRPTRRLEMIEEISERVDRRNTVHRTRLAEVKEKLASHRASRGATARQMAKWETTLEEYERTIDMVKDVPPLSACDASIVQRLSQLRTTAWIEYKGRRAFEEEWRTVEDMRIGLE